MSKASSKSAPAKSAKAKPAAASQVKVTLVRSLAGQIRSHQETVRGLGLRKIRQSAVVTTTPQVLGMLIAAQHMLKVEKA